MSMIINPYAFLSGYNIANAALPDGASYGTRTMGTVTSARVGSIDIFYARTKFGTAEYLWATDTGSGGNAWLQFQADDTLKFNIATPTGSANIVTRVTNRKFRDTFPLHIHIDYDTNQTDNTSCTITINNVVETSFSTTTNPSSAQDGALTTGSTERVFTNWTPASYATGYAAAFRRFDGTQVAASSFIEESAVTGNAIAVSYDGGSYGNEGWFLDFADGTSATTMLYDQSGNANNFTAAGTPTITQVTSTPTDVAAALNPLCPASLTNGPSFVNGNTALSTAAAAFYGAPLIFKIPDSGKFYLEAAPSTTTGGSPCMSLQIWDGATVLSGNHSTMSGVWGFNWQSVRYLNLNGTTTSNAGTLGAANRAQLAINVDDDKLFCGIDDSYYDTVSTTNGNPSAGTNPTASGIGLAGKFVIVGNYGTIVNTVYVTEGDWTHTAPTSFKAMTTNNLPTRSPKTPTTPQTGSFTGNASADGPFINLGMAIDQSGTSTINGNTVTWGTHADACATGVKLRTSSASYNASGSNTYSFAVKAYTGGANVDEANGQAN